LHHTHTHTHCGRTPLDEGLVCCKDLYMTTQNIHRRKTSKPRAGIEAAIPESELHNMLHVYGTTFSIST